jgi:chromate transporter
MLEVLAVFMRLGLTSFGGPVAHLGYFRDGFVVRRKCGPASSKVAIAIGLSRAGYPGAVAAWAGFTLSSAIALVFGFGAGAFGDALGSGWLHGLKVAAVAVVAHAVLGMMRWLAPDRERASMAVAVAAIVLAFPSARGQVGAILLGGGASFWLIGNAAPTDQAILPHAVSRTAAIVATAVFLIMLLGLPLLATAIPSHSLQLVNVFYRDGSLVFGGGHVVLPLLQAAVVPPGWVTTDGFLAGYGAAQAVPGPLFTFSAYLGTVMGPQPNGWAGAILCLTAMFLPSFLLVIGPLPFWDALRARPWAHSALVGVSAAVVGLLLAALCLDGRYR